MRTIKDLINIRSGESALIIAAGSSVRKYQTRIAEFIKETNPVIIGINNMTAFWLPDYHLWTNTKRFRNFGNNIYPESELLLGAGIHIKTIREVLGFVDYTLIDFTDMKEGVPIRYKNGKIYGFYRTAGNLAIMIAHLMGTDEVNIVGMDGHTFHNYEDIKSGKKKHHCYDEDYEPYPKVICLKKDRVVNGVLSSLRDYGIKLKILTPTIYEDFYDSSVLFGEKKNG